MASYRKNIGKKYVNKNLCVQPTQKYIPEAQYEAFQSIYSYIMYASYPPQLIDTSLMSPYELLCHNYNIYLVDLKGGSVERLKQKMKEYNINTNDNVIFFNPTGTTHYIAYINGIKFNPYDYYQVKGSQGFCQTFAFFLAIRDTSQFTQVDTSSNVTIESFQNLALNTQICATKIFNILDSNPEIMKKFEEQFNIIVDDTIPKSKDFKPHDRKHYGIKEGTTCKQYFDDFKLINSDLNSVKDYIYDLDLEGWDKDVGDKDPLWFSYNLEPEELATIEATKKRSLDTKSENTTKRIRPSMTTGIIVGSGKKKKRGKKKKKFTKKKRGGAKRKREKSKSIDSIPSEPDLDSITKKKRNDAAKYIQGIIRARLKADKRRKFTKRKFGTHKRPTTYRESNRRFLDHQKYLSRIGDLDEYRANMRQHYFPERSNRYIDSEYDYYGDMDDYDSNRLRNRQLEISINDLYDELFE